MYGLGVVVAIIAFIALFALIHSLSRGGGGGVLTGESEKRIATLEKALKANEEEVKALKERLDMESTGSTETIDVKTPEAMAASESENESSSEPEATANPTQPPSPRLFANDFGDSTTMDYQEQKLLNGYYYDVASSSPDAYHGEWSLLYRASEDHSTDGHDAKSLHGLVDDKGPFVVICRSPQVETFTEGVTGMTLAGNTVSEVEEDSPAATLGVKVGWRVVHVDGVLLTVPDDDILETIETKVGANGACTVSFSYGNTIGNIFGGYNSKGYTGRSGFSAAPDSFLFLLKGNANSVATFDTEAGDDTNCHDAITGSETACDCTGTTDLADNQDCLYTPRLDHKGKYALIDPDNYAVYESPTYGFAFGRGHDLSTTKLNFNETHSEPGGPAYRHYSKRNSYDLSDVEGSTNRDSSVLAGQSLGWSCEETEVWSPPSIWPPKRFTSSDTGMTLDGNTVTAVNGVSGEALDFHVQVGWRVLQVDGVDVEEDDDTILETIETSAMNGGCLVLFSPGV